MLAERFRAVIETRSEAAVAELYAQDALWDVNVPVWRFQRKGHAEILGQLEEWYGEGSPSLEVHEWPTSWGAVLQTEERGVVGGIEAYSRMLHALFVENGKVVRHIMYCTGPWDAETESRQKVEAPMYEPKDQVDLT